MSLEKYTPSEEEVKSAEEMMSEKQQAMSEVREEQYRAIDERLKSEGFETDFVELAQRCNVMFAENGKKVVGTVDGAPIELRHIPEGKDYKYIGTIDGGQIYGEIAEQLFNKLGKVASALSEVQFTDVRMDDRAAARIAKGRAETFLKL